MDNYVNDNLKLQLNLQFFAKDGPGGEKTEPATAKKLDDVRKNGQTAKSKELITSISLLSLFILVKIYVGTVGQKFTEVFQEIYQTFDKIIDNSNNGMRMADAVESVQKVMMSVVSITAPIFIIAVVIAFICNALQQKWMVTAEPLKPKFSKLNPLNGFKRIFSKNKLFETVFDTAKLIVLCAVVISYLKDKWDLVMKMYSYTLMQGIELTGSIIIDIGMRISLWFAVIGAADFAYQKYKFNKDIKMTKQEVKDEYKNAEGDPQIKGKIRQKMREVSQRRMMQDLTQADVVITNPTHFAVAIKYTPEAHSAPIVVAKGADYLAQKIKGIARENGIEIVENKPLARMLYANVDVGQEVPPELYQAVAEVLAMVYKMQGKL